jgi:hypothetical protein
MRLAGHPRAGRRIILLIAIAAMAVAVLGAAVWLRLDPAKGAAGPPPVFVDDTAASGLALTYDGDLEYSVGAGVAVLDCDDDGKPDLYLAGGAARAGLFRNDARAGGTLAFDRVSSAATDLTAVTGAYPIDVEGDRVVDLVVLRIGGNVVLRGLGDCRFERANDAWSLDGGTRHTMAFSAMWEGGNTWPTLAFGNYLDETVDDPRRWCEPNELIRPVAADAHGWAAPQELLPSYCTLSMLFSSWDGSGRMDLRVSNDRHYYPQDEGEEQLWQIAPGAAPRLYTAADGWQSVQVEGMGIGSYDLTGDGRPEVYLTSQAANHLMTLASGSSTPTYADIGLDRGTNVPHPIIGDDVALPSTSWDPEFGDVNNDGKIDLLITKGNVSAQPDFALEDPSNLLLGQADGSFTDVTASAGVVRYDRGRGAALVDLNLDGRLDLVESFYRAPVTVWRNTAPGPTGDASGRWIEVEVRDRAPNVDAIGGVLETSIDGVAQRRELTIGGGHSGGQLGWLHVGLGSATTADVRVRWADGTWSDRLSINANTFTIVDRDGETRTWQPGQAN